MNMKTIPVTIQLYASYRKVELRPKQGFRIDGSRLEIEYYKQMRSAGIVLVPDNTYFRLKGIENKVNEVNKEETNIKEESNVVNNEGTSNEEVKVESSVEVLEEIPTNPEDLRGNAIYTMDFLTRKKAKVILDNRGVEWSNDWSAAELKNKVIETNPQ